MVKINWEKLAKRLMALGDMGTYLYGDSGHIWIGNYESEENYHLGPVLTKAGILLNSKIYGGVLEALDTIDMALEMAGQSSLLDYYCDDSMFLGDKFGPDMSRIDIKEKDRGGIY